MKQIVAFILLSCLSVCIGAESQVVGFSGTELHHGWNEIKVDFDAFGDAAIFTTLDRIGKFSPPEVLIGDEIVFDLDGFRQKYRFVSFNSTNSAYTLILAMNTMALPREISLDWIPLPKVFWINHVSTKTASFNSSGELSMASMRRLENAEPVEHGARKIVVRSVTTNEVDLIYTFKGGRIKADSALDTHLEIESK